MIRVVQGPSFLDGAWHQAVAFDESGVIALDEKALALGISPQPVSFFTRAFHDAHSHPVLAGRDMVGLNVSACKSIAEVQTTVADYISKNPAKPLIVGGSYDRNIAKNGLVRAAWLDEVTGDQPVALHASDHHTLWVNTAALRLIPDEALSTEGVDMNGILRESAAKDLVLRFEQRTSQVEALLKAQDELIALGVTSTLDAYVDDEILAAYQEVRAAKLLVIDVGYAFSVDPDGYPDRLEQIATLATSTHAKAVKFFLDGAFGNATAAVSSEYETGGQGSLYWTNELLIDAFRRVGEIGLAPHVHAIGDRAIAQAIECLQASGYAKDAQIAHAELASEEHFVAMARLGIDAVMQPLWARQDGLLRSCAHHLGTRVDDLYQIKTAVGTGVKVIFGSDWPVSSANPLEGLYTAVNRAIPGDSHSVLGLEQAITLEMALERYQRPYGADFVTLSGNPFSEPLESILVTETIIGGQTRFTRQ